MGGRIDDATWDLRRSWVEKQSQSGLSAARFCGENDLKLSNFNAWKRKLVGGGAGPSPRHGEPTDKAMTLLSSAFAQLPIQSRPLASSSAQWIEIALAEGMIIRVPSSNLPALKMVLGAVGASRETSHA